jgi:RNA polymerase sigma factor (sigma-70 family)
MLKKMFIADKEILKRIKANDKTILGELYISNEKAVTSYIRKNSGSGADAQDFLQEALIILWQKATSGKLELTAKISTYIFAIAKNKWMAESRRHKKHNYTVDSEQLPLNDNDTLNILIEDDEQQAVSVALQKIGNPCRDILLMYYFEERSMADIALLLKFANSDVVKAKKYQCKKTLKKILESLTNK